MNHVFIPSRIDPLACAACKKSEVDHGNEAHCEACEYIGPCDLFMATLMCPNCIDKEKLAQVEIDRTANERVAKLESDRIDKVKLEQAHEIDASVKIRTDLFNASTVSIVELKKTIDEDSTIENKQFKLAEELDKRFHHLRTVLFNMDEERLKLASEQRAIQVYLNTLAGQLRQDERDKLKLQDITYQPKTVIIKKPKAPSKKKIDKVELRKYAAELGVSEFTLQMVVVSKGLTVAEAAEQIKASLDAGRSQ